jgi:hypothetical protein
MSDQGKWFKLHTSVLNDSGLEELSLEDFARWAKFGAYLKTDGTDGVVTLKRPASFLIRMFRVQTFEEVINVLRKFPNCVIDEKQNCSVSTETLTTVSFSNWLKYQGDYSYGRVLKFRANETAKKRREEKRRDEMRKEHPPIPPLRFTKPSPEDVTAYAKTLSFDLDGRKFVDFYESKGWLVGRSPMKSWQAAIRTWKRNGFDNGGSNGGFLRPGSVPGILKEVRHG